MRSLARFWTIGALLAALAGCAAPPPPPPARPAPEQPIFSEVGLASWYGPDHQGKRTASGERFDTHKMTAAHRSLAFGTIARVTNLDTGQMAKVRINDRGPYVKDRILDLSSAAARLLDGHEDGVIHVRIEVFPSDQPR